MTENSAIEWTDHTFNPWLGCTKISPACDHCYAETLMTRFGKPELWQGERKRTAPSTWLAPLKWQRGAAAFFAKHGRRQRVFCASLADVFDNQVPVEWRMDLFKLIADTPGLDWLLLTKRVGNVMPMCSGDSLMFDVLRDRVWLGATIANQAEADRDIPKLLAVPAAVRFLSMEPLLGPVDLRLWLGSTPLLPGVSTYIAADGLERQDIGGGCVDGLDWIIAGGESGPGARPSHPDWFRSIRDQCAAADVPVLFKQWGEWGPTDVLEADTKEALSLKGGHNIDRVHIFADHVQMGRVGKKAAGRLLDGVQHDGFPA